MSYVKPAELVTRMVDAGAYKLQLSTRDTLLRAFMGAAFLTLGAAFAVTVSTNTGQPLLGAVLFPVGFVILYLFGYDLLTGVFTLGPLAVLDKRPGATLGAMFRNWGLVFLGNFGGAFLIAILMAIYFTYGFSTEPSAVGQAIGEIGHGRTVGYADHGAAGMLTLFIRGVLCNWLVSTGVVLSMVSDNVVGKVLAMWLPIMLFFYMGFEHSIVNMFLFPSGLLLGADFTIMDYLIWNEIPTVIGNLVGGLLFVGLPLYFTYGRPAARRVRVKSRAGKVAPADVPAQTVSGVETTASGEITTDSDVEREPVSVG
ncbi:formate/nitrite transporter family protein [Microbacterium aerolatum]|uniref:Formate transporter n=1 Tax=Microbacterium aerolatum TaxID=153731 RepID=A0A511AD09_9MICO|nr:formate/nitrite transporter family protein [Microbacterium aerolatum]GEK86055.1 formate transporter [Microbacterium aerolatum]GGB27225.1 formate transporter [Microbacterium aerolatum]